MDIIQNTPTTLITGFLGAGKTTLINALLAHRQTQNQPKWALLINEFGKIGIDDVLVHDQQIAIKQIGGGCICCVSQLPLQIALVRLLSDHKPSHLLIEPTGLSHPDELIAQLGSQQWQTSLNLQAVICVINAAQWQQAKYREHDSYQAHTKVADVIVISRQDVLSADELTQLYAWLDTLNPHAKIATFEQVRDDGVLAVDMLNTPHQKHDTAITPLTPPTHLSSPQPNTQNDNQTLFEHTKKARNDTLPFRYHETLADYQVGGWRLPSHWQLDAHALQKWLLSLPFVRIKGIIHTTDGWLTLNITPQSITIKDSQAHDDARLEIITPKDAQADWQIWDNELMGFMIDSSH